MTCTIQVYLSQSVVFFPYLYNFAELIKYVAAVATVTLGQLVDIAIDAVSSSTPTAATGSIAAAGTGGCTGWWLILYGIEHLVHVLNSEQNVIQGYQNMKTLFLDF